MHYMSLPYVACNITLYNEHKLIKKRYPILFMCNIMFKVECNVEFKELLEGWSMRVVSKKFTLYIMMCISCTNVFGYFSNKCTVNVP